MISVYLYAAHSRAQIKFKVLHARINAIVSPSHRLNTPADVY